MIRKSKCLLALLVAGTFAHATPWANDEKPDVSTGEKIRANLKSIGRQSRDAAISGGHAARDGAKKAASGIKYGVRHPPGSRGKHKPEGRNP